MAKPMSVVREDTIETGTEGARVSSFVGAIAVTDMVKTTLGPFGMDKILLGSGSGAAEAVTVTNDGATILKSIHIDNPAAKVLVEISKTIDDEVGDGTTSVCVLAGELLREAEKLLASKLHPQTVIEGFRMAVPVTLRALEACSFDVSANPEQQRNYLLNVARTTLSSKILQAEKDHFATMAVDAVMRLHGGNLESIHIIKKNSGSLRSSFLEEGFLLEKKVGVGQPKRIENAKILLANTAMDTDRIKIFGAKVQVDSVAKVAEIEEAERARMLAKCKKIADHGVNVFINRQLIYNLPEQFFAERNIMAIEHADFEGVERLALVTGAEIVSTFDHPELVKFGTCKLIEEVMIGEDMVIKFSGVARGEACTIVLRGPTSHIVAEAERSLHDALCVLSVVVKEPKVVCGGGCTEMAMSLAVDELARQTAGKKALAIEAFARALRVLPTIIADNAGYDSSELVSQLRAAHASGSTTAGLDMNLGRIGDMNTLGIIEPIKVKKHVLLAAAEAAEMILRVDHIFQAPPRKRERDPRMG
ncbi:CCT chaperonin beta subunit [Pelomyxa schiedti]|nr:CCT chaperonin beta subunit [Pelomyxa schiedti]